MISSDDLERICRIGHDSSMRGQGLSLRQLLADTRYRELRGRIDHGILMQHLVERPELAQQWLMYSEDEHTSGGWYLATKGPEWEVGRLDASSRLIDQRRYRSSVEACASYILLELDFWAALAAEKSAAAADASGAPLSLTFGGHTDCAATEGLAEVFGGCGMSTVRDDLRDWLDIDVAANSLATKLGIWDSAEPGHNIKHVTWSSNQLGDALHDILMVLVRIGALEHDAEDQRFRWNKAFVWSDVSSLKGR